MSQTILYIEGVKELPDREKMESLYVVQDVYFTKFAGGIQRGRSLQITIGNEHVQLNQLQTEELAKILKEFWLE